jgi:hypothetical protein
MSGEEGILIGAEIEIIGSEQGPIGMIEALLRVLNQCIDFSLRRYNRMTKTVGTGNVI